MPTVTRNLLGNFVGRGIGAALSILLVPVYIRFLGVEAYGLVGFFLILQSLTGFFDLGLSTTTNREIALRVADDQRRSEARDVLRTVESIYWPIGIAVGSIVFLAAPWIAHRWLQSNTLGTGVVQTVIALMGLTLALQWPYTIYDSALHGLQRIVEYNTIAAGMQIVRGAGAVLVIWLWPTIIAFFIWQMLVSCATVALLVNQTWRAMPEGPRPVIRLRLLTNVWRFAAGMLATVILYIILGYADRIILSRVLTLESFGYYSVAGMVSTGLLYLMAPISQTVLPRFTELLAKGRHEDLMRTYHLSAQLMTALLTPVALVLALFSYEVLTIWTRSPLVAGHTAGLVPFLVIGTLLYALVDVPYMMQLAQGRTRLAVRTNLAAVLFYVPLLFVMVHRFGAIGAAIAVLCLKSVRFLIWGVVAHNDALRAEKWRWYIEDIARPALAAAAVTIAARLLLSREAFASSVVGLLLIGAIITAAIAAAALAAPLTRARARDLRPLLRQRWAARRIDK
ncbi:MAG: flippase [Acidobacteriota bacterium]|nr:flippase [Acidobacteriota bacterium]